MDVNYYLHREQVERMRAARAGSAEARAIHGELADLYRASILAYRARACVALHRAVPSIEPASEPLLIVTAAA